MGEIATQEGVTSNRYTILGRLAGGGMADIFLARVLSEGGVQRHVVLKRVLAERSRDQNFARMFLDEARLAAQLQHPNIAQLHDIGRLGGSYFYTMEYVHGADLRTMLATLSRAGGQVPLNLAMVIASGALAALRHAHTRLGADGKPLGVVHRDVSPSNVMVSYEGSVKLLDFGVAKASQHTAESRSGTIKGKIAYLSPEQCQNGRVDARSDLFSLGIVLHEMLLLRRMYRRDTDFSTMMAIVNEEPPVPSSFRPDIPPELDAIVLKALAKDPAQRYRSAGEMLEAIETFAAHQRMVMSATALGRFLGELVGDRPEPWLEVPAKPTEPTMITITGESVPDLVTAAQSMTPAPDLIAEDELAAQLEAAPAIGLAVPRSEDDSEPGDDSRSTAIATPRTTPLPSVLGPTKRSSTLPPAIPSRASSQTPAKPIAAPSSGAPAAPAPRSSSGPISTGTPSAPASRASSGPIAASRASGPIARPDASTGVPAQPAARASSGAAPSAPATSAPSGPIAAPAARVSGPIARPDASTGVPAQLASRASSGPISTGAPSASAESASSAPVATPTGSISSGGFAAPSTPTPVPFDVPGTPTPTGFPAAAAPLTVESSLGPSARDERNLVTAAVASLPFDAPDPEGVKQRRIIAIVVGAVLAVVIIVSIAKSGSGSSEPATPDASQGPAVAVPEPPPVVPDAAERTVEDPPPPPPDAAIVEAPKTVPQRLDDAIATRAWSDGVAVCKAEPKLAREDRARCAIIACNAREPALATTYYTSAPRSSRAAIEKACREQGISVAPRRGQDPCAANPLTCRK